MLDEKSIINNLLSIEHFAMTCEANAKCLRKMATGLRKQLGDNPPARLEQPLSAETVAKIVNKRNDKIKFS